MKIVLSPRHKRSTFGHIMAVFDAHFKCARYRDKGVVSPICRAFTAEQIPHLATPTYRTRKDKEHNKKTLTASPVTSTPTLVDPKDCKLIGRVEAGGFIGDTFAGKKLQKETPKASKKKTSKPTSDDLKTLHDKWQYWWNQLRRQTVSW